MRLVYSFFVPSISQAVSNRSSKPKSTSAADIVSRARAAVLIKASEIITVSAPSVTEAIGVPRQESRGVSSGIAGDVFAACGVVVARGVVAGGGVDVPWATGVACC